MRLLLDTSLTMKKQVATVYSIVSRNTSLIGHNRKYLSLGSCQKLASGLVVDILGYGNTLYFGLPNKELKKVRRFKTLPLK